ncbi:MAG: hypothetical protein RR710_04340 [Oscillospiraceae bacterium]
MNYKIGDTVGVSVYELYQHFGTHLNDCTIKVYKESDTQKERFYYDLFTSGCIFACCDGEEAEVIGIGNNRYFLKSKEEERDVIFSLTKEELGVANFIVNSVGDTNDDITYMCRECKKDFTDPEIDFDLENNDNEVCPFCGSNNITYK